MTKASESSAMEDDLTTVTNNNLLLQDDQHWAHHPGATMDREDADALETVSIELASTFGGETQAADSQYVCPSEYGSDSPMLVDYPAEDSTGDQRVFDDSRRRLWCKWVPLLTVFALVCAVALGLGFGLTGGNNTTDRSQATASVRER